MDRWGIPLAGVVLFVLLCWYCTATEPAEIEQDLTARSIAALQAGGIEIPPYGLKLDGQTAILSGPAGSPIVSEEARLRLDAVWGITEVVINAREAPAPPPAPKPASVAPPPVAAAAVEGDAAKLQSQLNQFLDGKNIRFAPNTDVLMSDGRRVLDEVAKILKTAPAVKVEIDGHTDGDGDAAKNLALSKRRAASVQRYLMGRGIPGARLSNTGHGAEKPLVPNDTPDNKTRNRRIEFHAIQ